MTVASLLARLVKLEERHDPGIAVHMLNPGRPFYVEAEKRLLESEAVQASRKRIVYRSDILPNAWPAR